MKRVAILTSFLIFLSCSPIRVAYDYQKGTDFSSYTTYNYYDEIDSGLSELDENRLVKALDSTLKSKGYLLSEEPGFLINIKSEVYRKAQSNSVGIGVGGGGRNVGGGVSVGIPLGSASIQRAIILDFVDADRKQLIWQADTESGFRDNASPSVREEALQRVVEKALNKFPPETK